MIRLKYVIDGLVFINDTYSEEWKVFDGDCTALNIKNPLIEGEYLLYTPPRVPKDRERGKESICEEGMHATGDDVVNPDMEKVIKLVANFISHRVQDQEDKDRAEEEAKISAIPADMKVRRAYLTAWSIEDQLEAFQDKLSGDSTKLDKMNLDFKAIKAGQL